MIPKILITHTLRWPNAARLALAFRRADCQVYAQCVANHPLRFLSGIERVYSYRHYSPIPSLRAAIEDSSPDLIVPCDDRAVTQLQALHRAEAGTGAPARRIQALIERSLGRPEGFLLATTRSRLAPVAESQVVQVPRTVVVSNLQDLHQWVEKEGFPVVLKADGTWGGMGVAISKDLNEANTAFRRLSAPAGLVRAFKRLVVNRDPEPFSRRLSGVPRVVSAQAFIAGRLANCAVACWQGQILASIAVEVIATQSLLTHATAVRLVDDSQMLTIARKLVRSLGISGFCGFDFILEKNSGQANLLEINPRATQLNHLALGPGHNLVAALRAQLAGEPVRDQSADTDCEVIALFPHQWKPSAGCMHPSPVFEDVPREAPKLVQAYLTPAGPAHRLLIAPLRAMESSGFCRAARRLLSPKKVPSI